MGGLRRRLPAIHHERFRDSLKPVVRAYVLGYFSTTTPEVLTVLLAALLRRKYSFPDVVARLLQILKRAAAINGFSTFCGTATAFSLCLQRPLRICLMVISKRTVPIGPQKLYRLSRFLAALIGAVLSFSLLNAGEQGPSVRENAALDSTGFGDEKHGKVTRDPLGRSLNVRSASIDDVHVPIAIPPPPLQVVASYAAVPLAGKSLLLTLFTTVRAIDAVWLTRPRARSPRNAANTSRLAWIGPLVLFIMSSGTVMHAFFYKPQRLPDSYRRWIARAANLDPRILLVMRHARYGTFEYGKDSGVAPILGSLCRELGLPEEWGDPSKTIPVPCELLHGGMGRSCEEAALVRFWHGWMFAAKAYFPIAFIVVARILYAKKSLSPGRLFRIMWGACRSSMFLSSFVALFYYGTCLARNRLGPKLFSRETITWQMWDSGLTVLWGCVLSGLSILAEHTHRQMEFVLFVAPRGLGVWVPKWYPRTELWKEQLVFSISAATLLTIAQERPDSVRGWFGRLLNSVLR